MLPPDTLALLARLKAEGLRRKTPNISDATGKCLFDLIRERNIRHILELGTANGYSTIWLAEAVRDAGGHVLTVEYKHAAYLEARENLAGHRSLVTQVHADAKEFCRSLSERFDLVFVDAGKKETLDYVRIVWPLLADTGILVVDDVVKFRDKMEDFYAFLESGGIAYEIAMTDPDDGIMVIDKGKVALPPVSL